MEGGIIDENLAVSAGDELSFFVGAAGDRSYDKTLRDPFIEYQ